MKALLTALIIVFSLSGCASDSDLDMLKRDVSDLRRDLTSSKTEIDSLKESIAGTVKEDSFSAVRENQAEMNSRVSQISNSLQELRGRFEENKYYLEKTLKGSSSEFDLVRAQISSMEGQIKTLKEKISRMEDSSRSKEVPAVQPDGAHASPQQQTDNTVQTGTEPPVQEAAVKKDDSSDDRTKAYEAAYQAFKDKKYKEARTKFESYIKEFAKNELSDNAQFWIAESYYAEKDYEGAILAYETVLKKYPDSEKTSGALFKQGSAFMEIGDKKTGKTIFEKVIEKFPGSREAELAKKRLKEMEPKSQKKR